MAVISVGAAWQNLGQNSLTVQNVGLPGDVIDVVVAVAEPAATVRGYSLDQIKETYRITPEAGESVFARYRRLDSAALGARTGQLYVVGSADSKVIPAAALPFASFTDQQRVKVDPNSNLLGLDAWSRNKTVADYSIYHGVFTYVVPSEMWVKYVNGVEDLTREDTAFFYSNNGKGTIKGAVNQSSYLMSRRHPRYQPNRGHLYSSSMICPSPDAIGIRRWGVFTPSNGAFFELSDGALNAVIRRSIDGVVVEDRRPIDHPAALDRGNIYDIQMQWRGVGNIKFFIGNPATGVSDSVMTFGYLNTLTDLSIPNPALPLALESVGDVVLECGCCDVSSEGGKRETRFYQALDSGELSLSTQEVPALALRITPTIDGLLNTRDCVLTQISGYCDNNALIKVYISRDQTSVTATWTPKNQGFQEFALNGDITAFDLAKMDRISTRRIPANGNVEIVNPDQTVGDFFLIHGDIILVTITAKNNTLGGSFLEYSEEI